MSSLTYTLIRGADEIELDIEYSVAAYDPGCSYGPPEACEPPSGGEVEDLKATVDGSEIELSDAEREQIEQHIYETHDYTGGDFYD